MALGGTDGTLPDCPVCADNAVGNAGAKSPFTCSEQAEASQGEAYERLFLYRSLIQRIRAAL